ncbi:Arginine metabolism regulation protein [Penicillium brevicompactum]
MTRQSKTRRTRSLGG